MTDAANATKPLDAESQAIIDEELAAAKAKENTIPKERLDAVIAERDQVKAQLGLLQNQIDLLKANLPSQQQLQPKQADLLDGIFAEDDTVVDKKQFSEGINRILAYVGNLAGQMNSLVQQAKHNDFDEVLQNHLPNVLKADPGLVGELQEIYKSNPARASSIAYRLAKTDPSYQEKINKEKSVQTEAQDLQQKINELLKSKAVPQSISAISSSGGATTGGGSKLLELLGQHEAPEDFQKFHTSLLAGTEKLPKE